jgi:hypothetical protein
MKENENQLTIPPAILALKDVTASEKMLLALYVCEPRATNFRALQVLGVGLSGLKKIKKRLLTRGLIKSTASGYRILVPGLTSESDTGGGHLVTNSRGLENRHKVAPLRKVKTSEQIVREYQKAWDWVEESLSSGEGCYSSTMLRIVKDALDATNDLPDGPEKDALLTYFTPRHDAFLALNFGLENLPPSQHRKIDRLIARATHEELATLRTRIEHVKLAGQDPRPLLQEYTQAINAKTDRSRTKPN